MRQSPLDQYNSRDKVSPSGEIDKAVVTEGRQRRWNPSKQDDKLQALIGKYRAEEDGYDDDAASLDNDDDEKWESDSESGDVDSEWASDREWASSKLDMAALR